MAEGDRHTVCAAGLGIFTGGVAPFASSNAARSSPFLSTRGLVWAFTFILGLAAWPALPAVLSVGGAAVIEPVIAALVVVGAALLRRAGWSTESLLVVGSVVMAGVAVILLAHLLAAPDHLAGAYSDLRATLVLVAVAVVMRGALARRAIHDTVVVAMPAVSGLLLAATLIGPLIVAETAGTKRAFPVAFFVVSAVLARRVEEKSKRWLVFVPVVALLASAVLGFFRYYFVVVVVIVVGLAVDYVGRTSSGAVRGQPRRAIGRAVFVSVLVIGTVAALRGVVSDYVVATESRYIQAIGKSTRLAQALAGESSLDEGDELRFAYYETLLLQPDSFLLPRRLGHDAYIGDVGIETLDRVSGFPANPIDSGPFFVAFFLGLPATLVFAIALGGSVSRRTVAAMRLHPAAIPLLATPGLVWLLVFLVTGNMFVSIPHAAAFGALSGIVGLPVQPGWLRR